METANRPYLVWDARRGMFAPPQASTPPADALPPLLLWQPHRSRRRSLPDWLVAVLIAGGALLATDTVLALLALAAARGWL